MSEVAKVVGLPKSKVKFWTIGRPLTIAPSHTTVTGKGIRNLYSLFDVTLMALARDLMGAGLHSDHVQAAVDAVRDELSSLSGYDAEREAQHEAEPQNIGKLRIILTGDKNEERLTPEEGEYALNRAGTHGVTVTYEIDLGEVVEGVRRRVIEVQLSAPIREAAMTNGPANCDKKKAARGRKTSAPKNKKGGRKK